jgi:hypothetical protein
MPVNVILKRQGRTVGDRFVKPGEMCMLPDHLADALAMYGLCDIAKPLKPGKLKPRPDAEATKKAADRAKKVKASRGKPPNPPSVAPSKPPKDAPKP